MGYNKEIYSNKKLNSGKDIELVRGKHEVFRFYRGRF